MSLKENKEKRSRLLFSFVILVMYNVFNINAYNLNHYNESFFSFIFIKFIKRVLTVSTRKEITSGTKNKINIKKMYNNSS